MECISAIINGERVNVTRVRNIFDLTICKAILPVAEPEYIELVSKFQIKALVHFTFPNLSIGMTTRPRLGIHIILA